MKYLYVGLLIFSLLVCACYFSTQTLSDRTGELVTPQQQARAASLRGDRAARDAHYESAVVRWRQDNRVFSALLSHRETDQISEALAQMEDLEGRDFARQCASLIRLLRRLREMDLPRIDTIF